MIADPYKVLGVDPGCTDTELKKAYREKSKKWHPDQNPDNTEYAEARFKTSRVKRLYAYCNRHGLFELKKQK